MPNNNNPNQSGRGPANTAASVGAEHLPVGIANALNRAGMDTQAAKSLRERQAAIEENDIFITGRAYPGQFAGTTIGESINKLELEHAKTIRRQEIIEESSRSRTISAVTTNINKSFATSSLNGQVDSRLSAPEIQRAIRQQAGSMSSQEVHHQMRASQTRLSGYEQELHGIVQNKLVDRFGEINPEQKKRMNDIYSQREEELNQRATLHGISKFYKEQGKDPMSQTMDILKTQANATSVASSGGAGTNEAKAFLDTLEKLNKVVDSTSQEFKDLSGSLDKTKDAFNAVIAAGPTFGGMSAKGWGKVGGAGAIASVISAGINTVGVDHRIANRANIANMAGLENSKYAMYKAARHGDVASQLAMSQWGAANEFGGQVKTAGQTAEFTGIVGDLAIGAAKTAAGAIATTATAPIAPLGALLGAGTLAQGADTVNNFVTGVNSLGKGIKSGQNYVQGVSGDMEARKAINAISAEQLQGARDFYVGAGTVSRGMGSKGEDFLKQVADAGDSSDVRMMKSRNGDTVNKGTLESMADAGISPEQMVQMADLGNKTLGSQFGGVNQITSLRKYEKASLGSMQENMGRMGQLSGAGSNNPQAGLESVMASAMAKGLDNSKALGMMVDNTAAMVTQSGNMLGGVDTTAVVAAQLASFATGEKGENKEFAITKARTAMEIGRQSETNVSTTFSGFMNTSRISAMTGLEGTEAITAGGKDAAYWLKLRGDPNAGKTLRAQGMDISDKNAQSSVEKMIQFSATKVAEGSGTANAIAGGISDELMTQLLQKGPLKEGTKEYKEASSIAAHLGYADVETYHKTVLATQQKADPNFKLPSKDGGSGGKGLQEEFDALATGGLAQLSEAAATAAIALKDIGGAVKFFTDLNEKYKKDGLSTEKESSTAAGTAAAKFELGADKFGLQVTKLESILNNVILKAGMNISTETDNKPNKTGGGRTTTPEPYVPQ